MASKASKKGKALKTFRLKWLHREVRKNRPGSPNRKGKLITVHLLELTTLDQQLLLLQTLFTFFTKQGILIRSSTEASLPIS